MMKKTYGVAGMVEWNALIPVGRGMVSVHFKGGSFTSYGMAPAEYSTSNVAMQRIIEMSSYFKAGKIRLIRTVESHDDKVRVKQSMAKPDETALKRVVVDSPEDAKDYLERNHGIDRVRLKSKSAIESAARGFGVEIVYAAT